MSGKYRMTAGELAAKLLENPKAEVRVGHEFDSSFVAINEVTNPGGAAIWLEPTAVISAMKRL